MQSPTKTFTKDLVFNECGLVPAIAQDWLDGVVLMMAWMNEESIKATFQTGEVHYWSRSRNCLWKKGETSGNLQKLKAIRYDCDKDVLLLTVHQVGFKACHTGERSCFYTSFNNYGIPDKENNIQPRDSCGELFQIISKRKSYPEEGSYTNKLLKKGTNSILKKIGEESAEFVMACKDNDHEEISNEAADLIYHLQVALCHHGVEWNDILKVLNNRRSAPRRD